MSRPVPLLYRADGDTVRTRAGTPVAYCPSGGGDAEMIATALNAFAHLPAHKPPDTDPTLRRLANIEQRLDMLEDHAAQGMEGASGYGGDGDGA